MQTILLESNPCGTAPCIDPIFGPTIGDFYWSSTTAADDPGGRAWVVRFSDGSAGTGIKGGTNYVRAVRNGL